MVVLTMFSFILEESKHQISFIQDNFRLSVIVDWLLMAYLLLTRSSVTGMLAYLLLARLSVTRLIAYLLLARFSVTRLQVPRVVRLLQHRDVDGAVDERQRREVHARLRAQQVQRQAQQLA